MHNRSLVSVTSGTPGDGISAFVQDILCASDSSKFYTPGIPSNDEKFNLPAFTRTRQLQIAQELHTGGFYIFTVDGPRVTVDYYSAKLPNLTPDASAACSASDPRKPSCEYLISYTPVLHFTKAETFGYSLNGKQFLVPQAGSYTVVRDRFEETSAQILAGANGSTATDLGGRHFTKTVNTGWTPKSDAHHPGHPLASDVLTLWGMADLDPDRLDAIVPPLDTFVLSMSFDGLRGNLREILRGEFGLAVRSASGTWQNAVDANVGGAKKFVIGPWDSEYPLGTYGVDLNTGTAWAVINHTGDFAVAKNL
jgi:hypothetical protein